MKIFFVNIFLVIKKEKLVLYLFLMAMTSEFLKYLNEQLCVFLHVKQKKWCFWQKWIFKLKFFYIT